MADYSSVFNEATALGLGLKRPPKMDPVKAEEAYREDPAAAFTKAAAAFQVPGDSIPVPFANVIADNTIHP